MTTNTDLFSIFSFATSACLLLSFLFDPMRRILLILLVIFSFQDLLSQTHLTPRVLIIGIDGVKWEALDSAYTPVMDSLRDTGTYSYDARTQSPTYSGPGWSSMLTGVWADKHGVTNNSFIGSNYGQYPHFFKYADDHNPALELYSLAHWDPINDNIVTAEDLKINFQTDQGATDMATFLLRSTDPDVLFVHLDDVDGAGHGNGFSSSVPAYMSAIETKDVQVGEMMGALHSRSTLADEDWIVILSTDHGGIGTGHGGTTIDERRIFTIVSGPNVPVQELLPDTVGATTPSSALDFDGADDHVRIPDNSVFDFGSNVNFTVECRVKTSGWSGDPTMVSDKNWNSGFNKGFGIFAQTNGSTWKANIGDGILRIDLNGGTINDDEWHHLSLSVDRSGDAVLYQDGIELDRGSMALLGDITSGMGIGIGQDGTFTYPDFFDGIIDEVRIWNTVVADTAIADWTCQTLTASHPNYGNLIGYWKFDGGSGTSLVDSSPTGQAGAMYSGGTAGPGPAWVTPGGGLYCIDRSGMPEIVDVAVTALEHLCVPINPAWELEGKSLIGGCNPILGQVDFLEDEGAVVVPNPWSGRCRIEFPYQVGESYNLQVLDLQGRVLLTKAEITTGTVTIEPYELPGGVYTFQLIGERTYRGTMIHRRK